jgi:hypothetical protein
MTGEELVRPIPNYVNFRDLGGHTTPDGPVRHGRIFRSDSLAECDARDIEHLVTTHGVRTVVDLRREHEVRIAPMDGLRGAGVRIEHRSLIDPAVPPLATPDLVDSTLADRYRAILDTSGARFADVIRLVADPANHPLVFQCAAGKDRTGLVAAMVLQVLGVDDAAITADYARTAAVVDLLLARVAARMPPGREAPGPGIMSAEAATMQATLEWLREHHGGAERYLLAHGLAPEAVATLRAELLPRG